MRKDLALSLAHAISMLINANIKMNQPSYDELAHVPYRDQAIKNLASVLEMIPIDENSEVV